MPTNPSAERMADASTVSQIQWEPWIDLPDWVQDRFGLREWNSHQRRRDESNRDKIQHELNRLQNQISKE